MHKKELLSKLKLHEWEDLEFKEAKNDLPKDIWKTVSAFANTEGGNIVFGINDNQKGKYSITGVNNVEKIQNDFLSTLRGEKFSIQLSSKARLIKWKDKKVIVFKIYPMPINCRPIYYGGDIRNSFIRRGSGNYKCSKEEISRMLREASEHSSDSMFLDGYSMRDIDKETIRVYKSYLGLRAPGSPFLPLKDKELMLKLGCLKKEPNSDREQLTMAGLLLFGKQDRIQSRFPAYEFDIYLHHSKDKADTDIRWDDRKIYEKNLINTYLLTMEYLKSKIEIPFALASDSTTRTEEVPMVIALREAFVNMLIHRDYFDNTQYRIKIFKDKIEMFNPGSVPKEVQDLIKDGATVPRNPIIAKVFRLIGWAETAGSGMIKIFNAWKKLGYNDPVVNNNIAGYTFKMTFPLVLIIKQKESKMAVVRKSGQKGGQEKWSELSEKQQKLLDIFESNPSISRKKLSKLLKINPSAIQKHIEKLKNLNLIERIGPDKGGHWKVKLPK